jgi:hypothetical protein
MSSFISSVAFASVITALASFSALSRDMLLISRMRSVSFSRSFESPFLRPLFA